VALFLTEAYISKGNHSEALNVLKAEIGDDSVLPANTFENILTGLPEEATLPIATVININMATLNFLMDNI